MADATTIVDSAKEATPAAEAAGTKAEAGKVDHAGKAQAEAPVKAVDGKAKTDAKATVVADATADKGDDKAGAWPEDWRAKAVGDDKAALAILDRYASPIDALKALPELRRKLSEKSEGPKKPGKDATPEELAAWRKAQGVPETPDKYKIKLKDDRVLGDDDKPVFDDFLKSAHEAGFNESQASAVADWYLDRMEAKEVERTEKDEANRHEQVTSLKEDWGADYKRNLRSIDVLFEGAPPGIHDKLFSARGPDGTMLGDDGEIIRYFAKLALELNPSATLIPAGSSSEGLATSIDEIEKIMRNEPKKYWGDEKMQARYRDLLGARDKMQARGKAA